MSDPVLVIRGLTRTYITGERTLEVLKGVDLEVYPGELVGLIGPSGSGKSSLLHAAGLLEHPTAGTIVVDGEDCSQLYRPRPHPHPAGGDRLRLSVPPPAAGALGARQRRPAADDRRQAAPRGRGARHARCSTELGLADRLTHQPARLSGGEQQRVAVARALANSPRLLLCDEPTGNLDPTTSRAVFQSLHDLARQSGVAALVATHNLELTNFMDRVLALRDGRIEVRQAGEAAVAVAAPQNP